MACQHNKPDILKLLFEQKADLILQDKVITWLALNGSLLIFVFCPQTVMIELQALRIRCAELFFLLLPLFIVLQGATSLHTAAMYGAAECVTYMLSLGVNADIKDDVLSYALCLLFVCL